MVINYKQAQLLIDNATGALKDTLKRLFAISIVSYDNNIKLDELYITSIKHYFTLPNQKKILEQIFNPCVLITEDRIRKYEKDNIIIVSDIGTTLTSIVRNNEMYLSLFSPNSKRIAKAFHSEEKAKEYTKQLLWKPGQLYWVKMLHHDNYSLKYASQNLGHFFINQNTNGRIFYYPRYKIATNVTLPTF